MPKIEKYGRVWEVDSGTPEDHALDIEFACIRKGGEWTEGNRKCGMGLFFHYKAVATLLWPEEDHHRWSDLILKEILQNDITVLAGAKDSGKTHGMSKYGLVDYWCFPDETLIIISSDTMASLERRIWGDIKAMFVSAKARFPWLDGMVIDSKHCICTDDLDDEMVIARDMRKGIACVPCKTSSGGMTNISSYVGIKQKRKRYLADEFQFMPLSMYDSLGNANSGNFKMVCAGNPIGQGDPLDIISEPKGGWDSFPEPEKTKVWVNEKFLKSHTVNLVGTDSPNFDIDQSLPIKYWYLTNRDSIAKTVAGYGKDSHQFYSQCKGVRRSNLMARRVITQEICRQFFAFDEVNWEDGKTKKIGALDAAYGSIGGDRCMGGHIEFGKTVGGKIRVLIHPPVLVPVSVKFKEQPEDQIAKWAKEYCGKNQIEPEDFFYDSTGRGALGTSFARIWSALVNPVEFGGAATKRPVSADLYIFDEEEHRRRPKRCDEHYRKFVTELWWSVRLVIESDQMRGMTEEICREGCMREWKEVAGNKIEVETKQETKDRMGRSPDIFDWLVTAVEGARRRGFQISKLSKAENSNSKSADYLKKLSAKVETQRKSHTLVEV